MTEENDHFYRLVTFTVEGCPQPMWELFEKKAKLDTRPGSPFTDLDSYLAFHQPIAQQMLNTRTLNLNQISLLYPRVDITKWDVTLASTMLQNFFKPLLANEQSLINNIRQVRNDLQHKSGSAAVDEPTFRRYWTTLRQSTLGLASLISTDCYDSTNDYIDGLQFKALPAPGGVLEILKEWYTSDKQLETDVKNTLVATKGTKQILNDTIVRSTNRTGAVSKRMKVTDPVLENMKAAMANVFKQTDLTDFERPSEISVIRSELRDQHKVVVAGYGNSKHLETCLYAIKDMGYTLGRCVQMTGSEECHHICCDDVDLVFCVDPFGKDNFDSIKAKGVSDYLDRIVHLANLSADEGRIDVLVSTSKTVLDRFKEEHDHELLENVVTINKPTTENEPHLINDGKQRRHADTKGNALTALQEQSMVYIGHLQQRYKEHPQLEIAKRMFRQHKVIVLIGPPVSRSDILAANLMTAYQSDQCVVLNHPLDWKQVKLSEISVILISEFTGKFEFNKRLATKWLTHFDIILAAVREGKLNVIITSRHEFLERCFQELSKHELLQNAHPLVAPYTEEQLVKIEPGISTDDDADQNDLEEVLSVDPHHDEQPVQFVGRYTAQTQDGGTVRHGIRQLCPVSRDVFLMSRSVSSRLYRLDSSYHEIDHLDMDVNVKHIVRMNDYQAAVNTTSVASDIIHVVFLAETMKVIRKIIPTVPFTSFDFQNDKFFICSAYDNAIHVYNVQGSPLHTIPYNVGDDDLNKSRLFKRIVVRNDRIVISFDSSKDESTCIVCLNLNGDQIWRRNTTNLSDCGLVLGLIIDDNNNVIISNGKQIIKVSHCGQHESTIIDIDEFGFTSAGLCISRPLSRLYVTAYMMGDDIIVYDYR